jgi:hypothetical protein
MAPPSRTSSARLAGQVYWVRYNYSHFNTGNSPLSGDSVPSRQQKTLGRNRTTPLRPNKVIIWILKTLDFIFLADENQGDGGRHYYNQPADEQAIEKIS